MSTDPTDVVHRYIAAWNAADPEERAERIAAAFAPDATYVDPLCEVAGAAEIHGIIGVLHERFPGHRFTLTSGPEAHHDRLRFSWALAPQDGPPVARGLDVGVVADGRLAAVTGFEEPLEVAA